MKKFLNNIKVEAGHIRLTHAEKAAMKARIFGVPSSVRPEPSPYVFMSFISYNMRMSFAGLLLFVLVGTGTASAAQGALPGDLLYAVKLSINEKVETALALTPAAKAHVEVHLAERRIEEAQVLAAEGRLNAAVAEELAVSFDTHAQSAQDIADAAEEKEPGTATEVKTKLASSLSIHGAVLQKIGRNSNNEDTKEHSNVLGTRVIARAEGPSRAAAQARSFAAAEPASLKGASSGEAGIETMSLSVADSSRNAVDDSGSQKGAALLQKKAAEALADAKKRYAEVSAHFDATTTIEVEKELSLADTHMSVGSSALGAGEYAQAAADFTEVLRRSLRLSALLKAEKKFDNGILKALIGGEVEGAYVEILPLDINIKDGNLPIELVVPALPSAAPIKVDLGL